MTQPDPQQSALIGSDPVAAMEAARQLAAPEQAVPTDIAVYVYDNYYRLQGQCGDYIEMTCTMPRLKLPDGTLKLKGIDPYADLALTCDTTVVPIVIEFEGGAYRWSGRVDVAHDKQYEDGTQTVECELVGDLTILDRILVWPQPFLPIEVQPSEAIYIGAAITVFKTMVAEAAMRLQLGINELINNLGSLDLDWRTWFATVGLATDNLVDFYQMVTTPVCVIPTNPLGDTSPWIAVHGRMDTCWKLMRQQLQDNGIYASMDLWLPGDPQPDGVLWPLTVATYCFNLKDYQNVTGPSGTESDGLVEDLVDFEGSILGGVLQPFLDPNNEYVPPGSNIVIAPTLGVNFTPPWAIFNADVPDSGIVTMDVAHHHPVCWQIVLGGQSPQWLNDAINATLEYGVDLLMMTIGITGISNSIFDDLLDNAFLAFEVFENYDLRVSLGPYGWPERFFPLQSTYDIDTLFAAISAFWDTRGYPAAQFTFYNGAPLRLARDFWPGQMISLIRRNVVYSDYIEIKVTDNVETRGKIDVQVGDGRREESAMTQIQRKIVGAEENLMLALGAPPQ